ncbi:MAG: hypothetical protein IPH88_11245 [Bacteroidales bacterium]|nr:hypothetical protein [Bacteroidales bacterium]
MKHPYSFRRVILLIAILLSFATANSQVKILFDATKAESAANADWVIDADIFNLGWSTGPGIIGGGNEANAQQFPNPAQSGITQSTAENYWKGGISAWGVESVQQGFQVETLPFGGQITYGNSSNAQDLSNYKIFVVCEPNIMFTATEKTAMMQFVQNGGGLFMVADHTSSDRNNDGFDSPEIWNDFMTNNGIQSNPFGISFDLASFSQTTSNIPNLPSDPLLHGTMGDVTQAMWSSGTSITISPSSNSTVVGVVYKTGSSNTGNTGVMVAYASYGSGKVVAIGDSSPCDDGTGDNNDTLYDGWVADANGNHRILIMNATLWLAATSASAPTTTTQAATSITTSSAVLNGSVDPNGISTTYYFQYGATTSYGSTTTTTSAGSGSTAVNVNATISGLTAGSTYHFRLAATNSAGTTYGSDLQFNAAVNLPTVTTTAASSITTTTASSGGNVSSAGGGTVTEKGVCWGSGSNPDINGNHTSDGTGTGTFSSSITSLTPGATFHIRAYATNSAGTAYGSDLTFTTLSPALSVTPANQNVTAAAGSTSYTVASNSSWTATSDQAWCTVTASGSGNGTITATYTENTSTTARSANITVTVTGLTPAVVTLSQAGASISLSIAPASQNVTAVAGTASYTVTSNTSWTASSDQAWCTVTPSGTGNGTITATYAQNTVASSRTATITVSGSGATPVTATLIQAAASVPDFLYTIANDVQTSEKTFEFDLLLLDNDPAQPFELGSVQAGIYVNSGIYNGGTITASIVPMTSTLNISQQPNSVTFTQTANVIKLAAKAPPGIGNGSILSTNPASPSRLCRIKLTNTVNWAQSAPNLTFCFTTVPYPTKISQYVNGLNTPLSVNTSNCYSVCTNGLLNPPPALSVSPLTQTIPAAAGTAGVTLTANAGWTASSDSPSWCTLSAASGFGNYSLTATVTENQTASPRTANITITVTGLAPVVATITQDAAALNKTLNLSVLIEGLYDASGNMHPAMDESGAHWGASIADKIQVELRDAGTYSNVIYTTGSVDLLTNGSASISIPAIYNGVYYITVLHRNSIETTTDLPVSFAGSVINYLFDAPFKVFGGNMIQKTDGFWTIYSGDVNQDGIVDSGDMIDIDNNAASFATGYLNSDVNGDGLVDSGDMIIIDNNASGFVSKITP